MASSSNTAQGRDRYLFYALVTLLVWAPIPLGSNRPWAEAIMQLWIFALAGLWLWRAGGTRLVPTEALRASKPLLVLVSLWLLYGLFQVLPLPIGLVKVLSPRAAEHHAANAPGGVGWIPLTLDLHASLATWLQSLAYSVLLVLVLTLVRTRERIRQLAGVLVLSAVLQSMLASLLALTGAGVWYLDPLPLARGTFPNRNHLAGYLEMSLAIGIGLLISQLKEPRGQVTWRRRLRDWGRALLEPKARLRIYLAIMVITLVLTQSRMGNTAFFSSLLIAGVLALMLFRRSPRPVLVLLVSLILVDILILGSWFGLDRVRQRLEQTVLTEEGRYKVDVQGISYLDDYLLAGSGGGSFYTVFPHYRREGLGRPFYNHAHNDYLELVLEFGILGLLPVAGAVGWSLGAALLAQRRRRDPLLRGMAFAAAMGIVAMLVHGTADFNLRIPANAALFVLLLALAWIALSLDRGPAGVAGEVSRFNKARRRSPPDASRSGT